MNKYLSFLGIIILLSLFACKSDDGEGVLALQFNAKVNDTPLEFNQYYLVNGDSLRFEVLKFYVSEFNVEDKDGVESILLKDVEIVDFKDESTTTINSNLAVSAYKNPSFNLGLTNVQNETEPTSYASEHPLSAQQGNYWMMANSYIYIKVEGQYLINGVEESFVFHIGANDYVRNKVLNKSFSIHEGNTTTILANLDVNTLFDNVDFTTESTTHSANPLAEKMLTNFNNSLSIN